MGPGRTNAADKTATGLVPQPRWLTAAWKIIAVAAAAVLAYGVFAVTRPQVLTDGFETYTDRPWNVFATTDGAVADFILFGFRLVGALNVAVGLLLLAVTVFAFRVGARWAWWTLLAANTVAYGAPMIYDQAVGSVGVFEVGEYVALSAVYVSLAATASMSRTRGQGQR